MSSTLRGGDSKSKSDDGISYAIFEHLLARMKKLRKRDIKNRSKLEEQTCLRKKAREKELQCRMEEQEVEDRQQREVAEQKSTKEIEDL